jgi:hypothetical protein
MAAQRWLTCYGLGREGSIPQGPQADGSEYQEKL